jgi:hypothetical protein
MSVESFGLPRVASPQFQPPPDSGWPPPDDGTEHVTAIPFHEHPDAWPTSGHHPGNQPPTPPETPAAQTRTPGNDELAEASAELSGLMDDPGDDNPADAALAGSGPAYEGAGVTVDRVWKFGPLPPRIPAMPREDADPEPVTPRYRRLAGRYRRNPSVDEAIAELARPLEEPSPAERAADMLRSKRPAKAGSAMRQPLPGGSAITPQQRLLLLDTWTRCPAPRNLMFL